MAQKRVRKWAREYLERNGASTAQEVFQYVQQKSNRNFSVRSVAMVMAHDPMIRNIDKITQKGGITEPYSVNLWEKKGEENDTNE